MIGSEAYARRIDRLRKTARGEPDDQTLARVREVFFSSLSDFPPAVLHDLFNSFVDRYYSQQPQSADVLDFAYYLGRVIDVLRGEYDERYPLETEEEWDAILDAVNVAADEMELQTLTVVMKLLLEHGRLS